MACHISKRNFFELENKNQTVKLFCTCNDYKTIVLERENSNSNQMVGSCYKFDVVRNDLFVKSYGSLVTYVKYKCKSCKEKNHLVIHG